MILGERLTEIRTRLRMSQGDVEVRTGLLRCYISRVENGHTVPSVETIEKLARAYEIPLYQIFYDGPVPEEFKRFAKGVQEVSVGGEDSIEMRKLAKLLPQMGERGRLLLFKLAKAMERASEPARKRRGRARRERIARNGQDRRFKVAVG